MKFGYEPCNCGFRRAHAGHDLFVCLSKVITHLGES